MAWETVGNIKGATGVQGPKGDTGETGPQGAAGVDGTDGVQTVKASGESSAITSSATDTGNLYWWEES